MLKLALIIPTVLLLAGCKEGDIIVEDNSPNMFERREVMRDCVAQYDIHKAPEPLRIACTQAVYGSYK